ncbi:MAG: sulfatase [Balneolaceae bacterium]|nr:sulfatase [Balneolaceae bacterium]MBO6546892.1 sulfatase [Balneolaceae bacterium]MBO6649252.1 sulfatase [Balneolaceae bacterium]
MMHQLKINFKVFSIILLGVLILITPVKAQDNEPQNVVFILSDDHRFDFMGFHPDAPSYIKTPNLDRMAGEGVHIKNAFVTTSLCSPSRASILTGQYAHTHKIVDNTSPIPGGTRFFNEDVQKAGYKTAFIGKWHMGESVDDPKSGWDHWVSFRGQGVYQNPILNVDGKRDNYTGYTSDILTDFAVDWLKERNGESEEPFFLYLSHKAVHAEFIPAERHKGEYSEIDIEYPETMDKTERNYRTKPKWVRAQRNSWHGVDYAYHGDMNFEEFYESYLETLLALDESVGRILDYLVESGLDENTLVIYMGDNGFMHGEHGLIDKRNAYEESIRVPMIAWAPGYLEAGTSVDKLVRNIDVAPTILDVLEAESTIDMDGFSFLPVLKNQEATVDREFLYEYYWEPAFPHTPTTFSLRGDRYKYIYYHGVWDRDELYDLENDPDERYNLAEVPGFIELRNEMRSRLFDVMEKENAMNIPVRRFNWQADEKQIE